MTAFNYDDILELYTHEDETVYYVLDQMVEDDILDMVNYWEKHDFIKTYDACDFVRNYLTYRED